MLGESLLLLDGEEHYKRRRLETGLFTSSALRYYESKALAPVIGRTLARYLDGSRPGEAVKMDLVPAVLDMLYGLGAAVLGIDGVDTPERADHFKALFIKMSDGATVTHSANDHDQLLREAVEARAEFIADFYSASLARRRVLVARWRADEIAKEDLPRDLLTSLILNEVFGDDPYLPLREMVLYMIASIRTTLHALPHVVGHLAEWTSSHPADEAKLVDPTFLRNATTEAIRLHAGLPSVVRIAKESVTLASGLQVEAGRTVSILLDQVNKDPSVFGPDADTFDPYRKTTATGPKGRGKVAEWGLAFGSGAHVCIGRRLVIGDEQGRHDEGTEVRGTAFGILGLLYAYGMTTDPTRPAKLDQGTFYDAYESFPIVLNSVENLVSQADH